MANSNTPNLMVFKADDQLPSHFCIDGKSHRLRFTGIYATHNKNNGRSFDTNAAGIKRLRKLITSGNFTLVADQRVSNAYQNIDDVLAALNNLEGK